MNKKIISAVLSLIMAAACLTGCSEKEKTQVRVNTNQPSSTEAVKELGPGEEFKAKVGENFKYDKAGLDVCFKEISQTAQVSAEGERCYAMLFTATNNSEKSLKIWMLDAFKVVVDEKELTFNETFSAISAANAVGTYPDYMKFDAEIEPGKSVTGFVPFQVKGDWTTMKINYKPDTENSNDYIVYEIKNDDILKGYE